MEENKFQNLENKLIDKTQDFTSNLNSKRKNIFAPRYSMEKKKSPQKDNIFSVKIIFYGQGGSSLKASLSYIDKAERGPILISGENYGDKDSIVQRYKKFLLEKVPEIADRLKHISASVK